MAQVQTKISFFESLDDVGDLELTVSSTAATTTSSESRFRSTFQSFIDAKRTLKRKPAFHQRNRKEVQWKQSIVKWQTKAISQHKELALTQRYLEHLGLMCQKSAKTDFFLTKNLSSFSGSVLKS